MSAILSPEEAERRAAELTARSLARKRSARARVAAKASSKARRAKARGRAVAHRRTRELAHADAYPVRRLSRERFARLFYERAVRRGCRVSERGLETLWQLYLAEREWFDAKGQSFITTNGQQSAALTRHSRPRCPRTVQRSHRELAHMGLLACHHVRRGGATTGNRDCLRVTLLQPPRRLPRDSEPVPPLKLLEASPRPEFCHPAYGSLNEDPFGVSFVQASDEKAPSAAAENDTPAAPARSAPPPAAENSPLAAPAGEQHREERRRAGSPTREVWRLIQAGRSAEDAYAEVFGPPDGRGL